MASTSGCAEEMAAIIETLDLDQLQISADEADVSISVKEMIAGLATGDIRLDIDTLSELFDGVKSDIFRHARNVFVTFAIPLIIGAICGKLARGGKEMTLIYTCACAACFLNVFAECFATAKGLLSRVSAITDAAFPVLSGFMALTGATATQGLLTPLSNLVSKLTVDIMGGWGIYLCICGCTCACAMAFGKAFRLDGIFALIKQIVMWGSGLLLTLFVAILAIQGMLGAGYDSAAMRTARFAIDKLIPVIGSGISDSLGTVISSVMMVKTAVGVTGMLLVGAACVGPLIQLWASYFAIKLALAAVSPVCEGNIMDVVERLSQILSMLITICIVSVTMCLILLGAAIYAGRIVAA